MRCAARAMFAPAMAPRAAPIRMTSDIAISIFLIRRRHCQRFHFSALFVIDIDTPLRHAAMLMMRIAAAAARCFLAPFAAFFISHYAMLIDYADCAPRSIFAAMLPLPFSARCRRCHYAAAAAIIADAAAFALASLMPLSPFAMLPPLTLCRDAALLSLMPLPCHAAFRFADAAFGC